MLNKKSVTRSLISASIIAASLLSVETHAKGGAFPEFTAPGQCTSSPNTTATAVLRKLNNIWYFALQVVGPNSVGEWDVDWTKNNVFVSTNHSSYPPPGGWAEIGLTTIPGEKGMVSFQAKAISSKGEVCSANISIKLK